MKTVRVGSLGELIDCVTPRDPDPASGRLRENAVFRGVAQPDLRLLTSLDRLGGVDAAHSKGHLEEHLLRNFLRYGKPFLPRGPISLWELMVIAEHHGLPTRLLDWTRSPLVAAHFATLQRNPPSDRVIWRLDWKRVHEHFGLREVVFLVEDLDSLLQERQLPCEWAFLEVPLAPEQHFVCLLEPPGVTERLAVQAGAFTFSSDKSQSLEVTLARAGMENALTRFLIPAEKSDYLRDQLDLCTFDERRLFPGLDGVAAELRRYYESSW